MVLANSPNYIEAYSLRNFFNVQFHPEILYDTARIMAVRDNKSLKDIMNSTRRNYRLPLMVISNFIRSIG